MPHRQSLFGRNGASGITSIASQSMITPARVIGLLAMLVSLAIPCAAGATALATCPNVLDITGYLHDADTGDGDFADEVEILDEPTSIHDVQIHASGARIIRGTWSGRRIVIKPNRVSDCDLFPLKGDGGIIVGRILSTAHGVPIVDPLRTESPRQRVEHGEVLAPPGGALPPPPIVRARIAGECPRFCWC